MKAIKENKIFKTTLVNAARPLFEIYYFCFSALITCIYNLPLVTRINRAFYGFPYDSLGGIWFFWWQKFSFIHEIPLRIHTFLVYPFGQDLSYTPLSYLVNSLGFIFTLLTNEVVAYNILKLASFPLLALTTYLLIYYLTKDRLVSSLIGLAYSFSPFHVIHNMAHFANIYWMPLAILFLLKLLKESGYKNAILFGFFWGITFIDNAYFAYFIGLFIPVFIAAYFFDNGSKVNRTKISFLKTSLISVFVACLVVFPMLYPFFKGIFFAHSRQTLNYGFAKSMSDLFIFSAKPLDYLLPSKYNPFLGRLVPDLGMGPLKGHKYTEHTLYLGYSLILLGGYAFYCVSRKTGQLGKDEGRRRVVYLFFTLAIIAAILSAPPFIPLGKYQVNFEAREVIAAHKIYLPQYFLFNIFPKFRVYARMGAMVLLALGVLAAFGLVEILTKIITKRARVIFLSLLTIVVFIEYAEFPPFRFTEVKEPAVYKWLAAQPGQFPIVEYPLGDGFDPYANYEYMFYQRIHAKYLVNGAIRGTPADEFRKEIIDISKKETINKLQGIGVRFVIVHRYKYIGGNEYVLNDWLTTPPRKKIFPPEYNDGKVPDLSKVKSRLRMVKDFGDTAVYEIINGT